MTYIMLLFLCACAYFSVGMAVWDRLDGRYGPQCRP